MTEKDIIYIVKTLCKKYKVRSLILFGSRAKGTATTRSDYDFAVSGAEDFYRLSEAVDAIPTLVKIDLVNLDTCHNQLLMEDIERYGCKIL